MDEKLEYKGIPTDLNKEQFDEFFGMHLSVHNRGRKPKLSAFRIFRGRLIFVSHIFEFLGY